MGPCGYYWAAGRPRVPRADGAAHHALRLDRLTRFSARHQFCGPLHGGRGLCRPCGHGLEPRRGEREEVRRHPALGLHGDRHMAARGRGDRQTCGGTAVESGQQDHAGKPRQLPDDEGQPVSCITHFPPLGRDGVRRFRQLHEQREDRDHREPVSAHAGAGAHGGAADPLVLRRQPAGADRARRPRK